jgi:hypothetical protein
MFTHTKTARGGLLARCVDASCQKGKEGHGPRVWQADGAEEAEEEDEPNQYQTPPTATAEKNKIKQPHIRLALSRAGTLTAMDSAPKRKRSGITPDSCGKAGDPHNLEGGALASRNSSISIKRRRTLDAGWDLAADEAGSSAADAILAA